METTFKIFLRTDNTNIDGSNTLYLLFTSKRKLKKISLKISVKAKDWDNKKNQVRRSDPGHLRKNKYIRLYAEKAQRIIDKYFIDEKYLSIEEFERNFRNKRFSNSSFFEFINDEMTILDISEGTRKNYLKQLAKLKSFRQEISFSDIDLKFIQDYDYFLRNVRNNNKNTRLAALSFLKQAINKAIKKGVTDVNPFRNYPLERMEGNKEHLTKLELEKLENLMKTDKLNKNQRKVLEYFLFACYTGLRYSDIKTLKFRDIKPDIIEGKEYKFIEIDMHKTGNPVTIPVLPFAEKLIKEKSIPNAPVFHVFTNQSTNRHLKKIMQLAEIDKNATFHVARHTLGSTGSDLGMSIEVISAILGHTELKTTQIYTKISKKRMVQELMKMK